MTATKRAKPAAKYIGVSYWKLLDMVKKGEIPHIRAGKLILFRKATLDEWLREQEIESVGREA
jgi:excisionase family DNA binding protein